MTTTTDATLTGNTDPTLTDATSSSSTTTPVALTAPVLTLDQADTDYAPGETVGITASNVAVGGSVQFSVAHVTGGVDGIVGTADDVLTMTSVELLRPGPSPTAAPATSTALPMAR